MPHPRPRRSRHPPDPRPGKPPSSHRSGFTPPGLKALYRVALPGWSGGQKRAFFNTLARWLVAWFALCGTLLGYTWAGPFGAIIGCAVSLKTGAQFVVRERFFRR